MDITKEELENIIKEELEAVLDEKRKKKSKLPVIRITSEPFGSDARYQ